MKVPDGYPLVKGRFVTGFANPGEAAIELMQVVPFLVEDMLKRTAASIRKRPTGHPHVVVDGNLITGQNPASAQGGGKGRPATTGRRCCAEQGAPGVDGCCCGRRSSPPSLTGAVAQTVDFGAKRLGQQ